MDFGKDLKWFWDGFGMIFGCQGKPFDPKSIKRERGGEERRGRGEEKKEKDDEGERRRTGASTG